MAEIIAAIDEGGANTLIHNTIASLNPVTKTGSESLGPFVASYTVTASLTSGGIDLIPPDIIRLVKMHVNWNLNLSFGIDLSTILPNFCLPRVCVKFPFLPRVCTPRICIDWPTIPIHVSLSDFLEATGDFRLDISLNGGNWEVQAVILGLPNITFGPKTALFLAAIGAAITPVLLAVPFIGPFLAIAINAILLTIGLAGVTGLLGPILTPFVTGLKIPLYKEPQLFEMLPTESPIDPAVHFTIDLITAEVINDGEDELVLSADISA
jgi:hypothetical protein